MTWDALRARLDEIPLAALYVTIEGCAPCKAVRPWAQAMFEDSAWEWIAVDSAESPEVTGQLLVFAHPTLILFERGIERARFSRIVPRAHVERTRAALEHAHRDSP